MALSLELCNLFPLLLIIIQIRDLHFSFDEIVYNRSIRIYPGILELGTDTLMKIV